MVAEPLSVLSSITSNPDRLEELEEGVQDVSRRTGCPLTLTAIRDPDEIIAAMAGARVLLTYRLSPEQWAAGRHLKWIHFGGAGIEHSLFPELLESDVLITTSKGMHGDVMAEYALMAILALAVGLPQSVDAARRRQWIGRELRGLHHSVAGKCLLVLGLGEVGLPAAQLAASVGMRVTGVRRTARAGPLPEGLVAVHTADGLDRLLPETDYLLLALPTTPLTRGIINEERLRSLPPDAGLINMARGALVDEEALLRVLEEGHLRGVVLDSFQTEPLPSSSPLWEHPRVLVTPHIAGNFNDYTSRVIEQFVENLRRFLTGERLYYHFDRGAGY